MTLNRLGSANAYNLALSNLQSRQSDLANLQAELSSGKKINTASDDPIGAAQAERANNRIARIATDQRALQAQQNSITAAEGALGDVTTALQSFRQLVVNAGDGANTAAERQTFAVQMTGLRDQIMTLANTKDSNGQPLFAALGSALAPFVGPSSLAPDYTFKGLPGQSDSGTGAIPYTLDGESAFMLDPTRDHVFDVTVGNTTSSLIPPDRALVTDGVSVTSTATVSATAAATATYNATLPPGSPQVIYPTYTVSFTALDATTTPGTTTVTYDINENPPVSTGSNPIVSAGTASYPTGGPANIPITGIPGLSFNITGTPPVGDQAPGATATVVGSPAVGDTVTVAPTGSVFSVMDSAIKDIGNAANANAANQGVAQALANIDTAMARVSAVRGQAGTLLNRADTITTTNTNRNVEQQANLSNAQDLNMIKGVSDFQSMQTGYSAALQSYAQVQKLSLFNFLS